ncbi:MAG: hypothetical protein H6716_23375 [Polyangiaceae bacterium]|nr:hypothetical protein [Polyangiaceae bacterium]
MIPLVARPLPAQAEKGLQPVGYVNSEGWKPTLNVVGTNNEGGWPTPYARAANTAFLLSELPATSNFAPVSRVQSMALATTLGILRPKLIDLSKGGSFERALLNAEPSVGLFWALENDVGVVYGYSYPTCLFWPHARRNEDDWRRLDAQIGDRAGEANSVLARFRDALDGFGGLGAPGAVRAPPWKVALDHFTKGVTPADDTTWEGGVAFVGPIVLEFPEREDKQHREPIYWPTLQPSATDRFYQATNLKLVGSDFVDGRNVRHGSVVVPDGGGAQLLRGAGGARIDIKPGLASVGPGDSATDVLAVRLTPVVEELRAMGRMLGECQKHPFAYPDAVRWLARAGHLGGGGAMRPTSWFRDLRARQPGLSVPPSSVGQVWEGVHFVEEHAGTYVGDLGALGHALYVAFSTDMSVTHGMVYDATARPLLRSTEAIPLEATELAHERLPETPPAKPAFAQLATLQRFVHTYDLRAAEKRGSGDGPAAALLAQAAKAYAKRAYGADVRPLGSPGTWSQHLTLESTTRIEIAQDVHLLPRRVF